MRRLGLVLLVILLVILVPADAKKPRDLRWVDTYALAAPTEAEKDLETLARYLAGKTAEERQIRYSGTARDLYYIERWDEERARAIYRWITDRIVYHDPSAKELSKRPAGHSPSGKRWGYKDVFNAEHILKTRATNCFGYSVLYQALANESGLKSDLMLGYYADGEGHAWNEVRIGIVRMGVDATWGAEPGEYQNWCLVPLGQFRKTHLLEDPDPEPGYVPEWLTVPWTDGYQY
ncbi:MAG: hypothetical protein AMXMBFR33_31700 [Candidatus Xenobia bacterium]